MNGVEATGLPSGYGLYLLQTLVALGVVCLLAWVVLRFGLRRLYGVGRRDRPLMRVVDHLSLEPRRSLYLVEVEGKRLLLGTGEQGMSLLTEVDPAPVEPAEEDATTTRSDDPG